MSRNIRILYLYLVSLITLGMTIVGFVGAVNNLTSYFAPTVYDYYYYDYIEPSLPYESDLIIDDSNPYASDNNDLVKDYKKRIKEERVKVKKRELKDMFTSLSLLLVSAPLYVFHYKKAKEEGVK